MKKLFLYVIAWKPEGGDLTFRSVPVKAQDADEAYSIGHTWAAEVGILPLAGPGNDYVIDLAETLGSEAKIGVGAQFSTPYPSDTAGQKGAYIMCAGLESLKVAVKSLTCRDLDESRAGRVMLIRLEDETQPEQPA